MRRGRLAEVKQERDEFHEAYERLVAYADELAYAAARYQRDPQPDGSRSRTLAAALAKYYERREGT